MNPEKNFNPSNPEYKEVKDLPQEVQKDFADVEGGFVTKEALEHAESANEDAALKNKRRGILQKLFNVGEVSELDVLHEEAFFEDKILDNAKNEERIKKEEEKHEMERQDMMERERVIEEKWKNSEEFKKLALFEEFLTTKPKFEEVNSILHNFSKNYFDNRTEAALKLFKKARQLTYKKSLPLFNDDSLASALMMPSDPSGIDDDLEFIVNTEYRYLRSNYPIASQTHDKNYIDVYRMSREESLSGGMRLINSSLAIAALPGYYEANFPARELSEYARVLLKNTEWALKVIMNESGLYGDNNGANSYLPNYSELSRVFNLRDHDGESISGYFPDLDSRLKQLESPLKEVLNMDKDEFEALKKRAVESRSRQEELKKNAKQEEERKRADEKQREAENAMNQRELTKKLLG